MAELVDTRELEAMLERMEGALAEAGSAAATEIRADLLRQFQAGGDPRWLPLTAATVRAKRKAGYPRLSRSGKPPRQLVQLGQFSPGNVLMRTGALLSSWTNERDPHHFEEVGVDGSVSVGSRLPYAATHQYGDERLLFGRHRGEIPARPLRITEEGQKRAAEAVEKVMVKN